MTIIATYRREDIAIYIYDSLLTVKEPNKQLDASFKFIALEERIGIFLSGDVNLWKKVIDKLENKISFITVDNILDFDGIFRTELNKVVGESPSNRYTYSRALGFIRDDVNKRNLQFLLELNPGKGCLITEVPDGELKVIGSGSYVPDIEPLLKYKFDKLFVEYKKHLDLYHFASNCREEIEGLIQACGPSIYKILGISTVLSLAYIVGDYFIIIGEEREGGNFTKVKGHRHKFSTLKSEKGEVKLLDHLDKNKGYYLNIVFDTTPETSGEIFDPRFSYYAEDPLKYYCENSTVYWIDQWVEEDYQFLWRKIERVEYRKCNIRGKTVIIPHPNRHKIVSQWREKVGVFKIFDYQNIDEMYFSISKEQSEYFEKELASNIFNHAWLKKYITKYDLLYKPQSFWKKYKIVIRIKLSELRRFIKFR
ncbi:hypothetical protein [Rossellomorea aquimaris]|uniref:Uncharacterized protein n=1 Tax=Rossellomorea aquimaris TaxID=189382 RepID=A0A5D4T8S3_9BACI|nr:hypothetical protein [Rossellomorea aquimaris]TYS71645.1 hypothetical protein FZC80_21645 [Rossellomorea aquimaris]